MFAGLFSAGWVVADESAGRRFVCGPANVMAPAINTNTKIRTRTAVLTMFTLELPYYPDCKNAFAICGLPEARRHI
jgi:hypothetical protein